MLDPESRSGSFIVLSEREVTATMSDNAMGTVVGIPSTIPSHGTVTYTRRWYFEVEVNLIRGGIHIGVINADAFKQGKNLFHKKGVGEVPGTYGIDSYSGSVGGSNTWKPYAKKFRKRDIIGVILDFEKNTISFSLNGKRYGVAFHDVPSSTSYFPAVTLKYKLTSVTLNFGNIRKFKFPPEEEEVLPLTFIPKDLLSFDSKKSAELEEYNRHHSLLYRFSEEVIQRIFTFLHIEDLVAVSLVSRLCARLAQEDSVWKQILINQVHVVPKVPKYGETLPTRPNYDSLIDGLTLDPLSYKNQARMRYNWLHNKFSNYVEFYCDGNLRCLEFDEKYLFAGMDGSIAVYYLDGMRYAEDEGDDEEVHEVADFFVGRGSANCVHFDSQKEIIFGGFTNGAVMYWNLQSKEELGSKKFHSDAPVGIDVHNNIIYSAGMKIINGEIIGEGHEDGKIVLYDLELDHVIHTIQMDKRSIKCMKVVPQENFLIIGGNKSATIYDLRSFDVIKKIEEHAGYVLCLDYDSKTHALFTGGSDKTLKCYDIVHNMGMWTYKSNSSFKMVQIKNNLMVSASANGIVRTWNEVREAPMYEINVGAFQSINFNDEKLRCGYDGKIKAWDFDNTADQTDYSFRRNRYLSLSHL